VLLKKLGATSKTHQVNKWPSNNLLTQPHFLLGSEATFIARRFDI
jgi:hypothetical protein